MVATVETAFEDRLNLDLALTRVLDDLKKECFIEPFFESMLINSNRDIWIEMLKTEIKNKNYNPSKVKIIDVPKPNWHIRPGTIMTLDDMVIYSALIMDIIDKIKESILLTAPNKFSYKLKKDKNHKNWFEYTMMAWNEFQKKSVELLKGEYKYVLFADISSFFENISIIRLIKDLDYMHIPEDTKNLLSRCLNRWSEDTGKGLCQGMSPSYILADIYLNSIDERLMHEEIVYLRYVDDYRIFCKTKKEAIKALHFLTKRCRERGLNLHTGKTKIKEKKESLDEINGISETISTINMQIRMEMTNELNIENPYATPSEIKYLLQTNKELLDLVTIRKSFEKYFLSESKIKFDKSLFHYLINRLGASKNDIAVDYCLDCILKRPEETRHILNYFSELPKSHVYVSEKLIDLVDNNKIIYEYQKFKIVQWFFETKINTLNILKIIRKLIDDPNVLQYTRNICIAYLGCYGRPSDLDLIEKLYSTTDDELSKANILYSLRKMPKNARNGIYARAKKDGYYIDLAIALSKSNIEANGSNKTAKNSKK